MFFFDLPLPRNVERVDIISALMEKYLVLYRFFAAAVDYRDGQGSSGPFLD